MNTLIITVKQGFKSVSGNSTWACCCCECDHVCGQSERSEQGEESKEGKFAAPIVVMGDAGDCEVWSLYPHHIHWWRMLFIRSQNR